MPLDSSEMLTAVTSAYDSDYTDKTVLAIDVHAPGLLVIEDIEGTEKTYTFTAFVAAGGAYAMFPHRLVIRLGKIVGDGAGGVGDGVTETDIALANLTVLH